MPKLAAFLHVSVYNMSVSPSRRLPILLVYIMVSLISSQNETRRTTVGGTLAFTGNIRFTLTAVVNMGRASGSSSLLW